MISVLVAVYNAERYLRKCLDSLIGQTFSDIEIICIDDASTDSSWDILQEYKARDERIILLRNTANIGQAASRNRGIEIASGQYICYLDSDDWFNPDSLSLVSDTFQHDPAIDCVLFTLVMHYPDSTETFPSASRTLSGQEACHLSIDWHIHGVYAAKAELFRQYPYDTSTPYYSDDNTTRIHYLHSRKVATSAATYNYRRHADSGTMKLSIHTFDHILANISLKETLIKENVPDEILDTLELHRLYNLLGAYKTYWHNKHRFSGEEIHEIHTRMSHVLKTIEIHRIPKKRLYRFGYYPIHNYPLFRIQEELFWTLRKAMHKDS